MIFTAMNYSCDKEEYDYTATITGTDIAMCACCGSYFIEIDGIQYRFEKSCFLKVLICPFRGAG